MQPRIIEVSSPSIEVVHVVEAKEMTEEEKLVLLKRSVKYLTDEAGIEWELVDRLITCESRWDINADNGSDRGLWQWNRKAHPHITDEMALDPIESTKLAIEKYKEKGDFSDWVCANCYGFIEAYYYDLPKMKDLKPNIPTVQVGATAIFNYKAGKHVAYVTEKGWYNFTVKECNFIGGHCGTRLISYTDPFLLGLYKP